IQHQKTNSHTPPPPRTLEQSDTKNRRPNKEKPQVHYTAKTIRQPLKTQPKQALNTGLKKVEYHLNSPAISDSSDRTTCDLVPFIDTEP
ncbi:MAG: hypothetical protein OXI96_02155, partial [Acidimicrobiaceae bacterium]|nr:hypothetical protein [Acidimicrobiaceae bacterium]